MLSKSNDVEMQNIEILNVIEKQLLNYSVLEKVLNSYSQAHPIEIINYADKASELNERLEECFAGIKYGIHVKIGDEIILNLATKREGDSFLVSDIANKRRRINLLFNNYLCEYIKERFTYEADINRRMLKSIEIKQELLISTRLFEELTSD